MADGDGILAVETFSASAAELMWQVASPGRYALSPIYCVMNPGKTFLRWSLYGRGSNQVASNGGKNRRFGGGDVLNASGVSDLIALRVPADFSGIGARGRLGMTPSDAGHGLLCALGWPVSLADRASDVISPDSGRHHFDRAIPSCIGCRTEASWQFSCGGDVTAAL